MLKDESFETIEKLILDENKIVTYKSLSRHLNIYAHEAKQCLLNFLNTYRAKYGLSAHYAIIGKQEDDNGYKNFKVLIVPEVELECQKLKFDVTSNHIYCVHKGEVVDKNAIYTVDLHKNPFELNKLSAIVNANVEIQPRKIVKPTVPVNGTVPSAPKQPPPTKTDPPKSSTSKGKGVDIFSMLKANSEAKKANGDAKAKAVRSNDIDNQPGKNPKKAEHNGKQNKGDVRSMFSKQAEKNLLKSKEKDDDDKATAQQSKEPETATNGVKKEQVRPSTPKQSSKNSDNRVKDSGKKKSVAKPKKTTKRRNSDDDSDFEDLKPLKKKHKRIMTLDSESESETEETKDKAQRDLFESKIEVEEEPSHDIPTPPAVAASVGKRKKLKTVKKHFKDEEGFFVTKSVKEYVSCSDESDKEESKKSEVITKAQVQNLFVNKKQSSLMSFFKQK